jgi:hypothetical protein
VSSSTHLNAEALPLYKGSMVGLVVVVHSATEKHVILPQTYSASPRSQCKQSRRVFVNARDSSKCVWEKEIVNSGESRVILREEANKVLRETDKKIDGWIDRHNERERARARAKKMMMMMMKEERLDTYEASLDYSV